MKAELGYWASLETETRSEAPVARLVVVGRAGGRRIRLRWDDRLEWRPGVDIGAGHVDACAAQAAAGRESGRKGVAEVQILQAEVFPVPDIPGVGAWRVLVVIRAKDEPRPLGVRVVRGPRIEQIGGEEVLPGRTLDQRAVEEDVLLAHAL